MHPSLVSAYVVATIYPSSVFLLILPSYINHCDIIILLPQVTTITGDLLVLAVGQARQMGRMINVCPEALLDDGLLDFTLAFGSAWRQVR
jgi:hypothetical protein